jgi:hypothetical protein
MFLRDFQQQPAGKTGVKLGFTVEGF